MSNTFLKPMYWCDKNCVEPTEIADKGYKGGDNPAAEHENYFRHQTYLCVKELQQEIETLQQEIDILHKSIKILRNNVFSPCGEHVTYEISGSTMYINGTGSINDSAFKDSGDKMDDSFSLLNIDIKGKIGIQSFSNCNLQNINIKNCTEIGGFAFAGNSALNYLFLCKTVSTISEGVLTGCGTSIENGIYVEYEGTIAEWNAIDKNENWIGDFCKIKDNVIHCKDGDISIS
ncbi:MAG: leucine-rich repeat protein [Ruminococcus sp.]|nr:leucine-rich repeat protein [Ruminococcus sp.]